MNSNPRKKEATMKFYILIGAFFIVSLGYGQKIKTSVIALNQYTTKNNDNGIRNLSNYYSTSTEEGRLAIGKALSNGINGRFAKTFKYFDAELKSERVHSQLKKLKNNIQKYIINQKYDLNNPKLKAIIKSLDSFHITLISDERMMLYRKTMDGLNGKGSYGDGMIEDYKIRVKNKTIKETISLQYHEGDIECSVQEAFNKIYRAAELEIKRKIDDLFEDIKTRNILKGYSQRIHINDGSRFDIKNINGPKIKTNSSTLTQEA